MTINQKINKYLSHFGTYLENSKIDQGQRIDEIIKINM